MKTYTSYINNIPRIINNSQADNQTWAMEVINDSTRYLVSKYYFNERSYTVPNGTQASTQFYNLPPQIKKLINVTITIGGVLWQPKECPSREFWDALNVITFTQDFPSFYFVFNGQVGIYPTPSSSGNTITLNYKTRITDLTMADVTSTSSTQTMAATLNSTTLTASGAVFKQWMAGQWIRLDHSSTDAANGDAQWYQINSITNSTTAVLKNVYSGASVSGASFTIGEVSLLPEDYQDLPLYRMASIYYTTRFPDPERATQYTDLYDKGVALLNEEFGSKSTSVVLTDTDQPIVNPNLFQKSIN